MSLPVDVHEGVIRTNVATRLLRIAARNVWWLLRTNRMLWLTLALLAGVWACTVLAGPGWTQLLGTVAGVTLALWRLKYPVSFRRQITLKIWAALLRTFKYGRRWRTALKESEVIHHYEDPPHIIKVTATRHVHKIKVKMNVGHTLHGNYDYNTRELAQSFNAIQCSTTPIPQKPQQLELQFIVKDPLIHTVEPYENTAQDLFSGYKLAKQDDLQPWKLKVVGTHIAVGGETGSGKGSVFWSLIMAAQKAREEKNSPHHRTRPQRWCGTRLRR